MNRPPLWIPAEEVTRWAELPTLVEALRLALQTGERARCQLPERTLIIQEGPYAAFGVMAALGADWFVTKQAVFIDRPGAPGAAVRALVCVFSRTSGAPVALLDGAAVTLLKSAAAAGVVAEYCAPPQIGLLAVLGTGAQAEAQLRGVLSVRSPEELRIYSRNPENVRRFRVRLAELFDPVARVQCCTSAESAAFGADVLVTATSSRVPILRELVLPANGHVHCAGGHTPDTRELPVAELARARLIVEDVPTAVREAGGLHRDALDLEHMFATPRTELQEQLTIFSSTGHAFLDLVATAHVIQALGISPGGAA